MGDGGSFHERGNSNNSPKSTVAPALSIIKNAYGILPEVMTKNPEQAQQPGALLPEAAVGVRQKALGLRRQGLALHPNGLEAARQVQLRYR